MNADDQLMLKLVEELILSWGANITPEDISFERDKIQLLIEAKDLINQRNLVPPASVRQFYEEVFLRDQFTGTKGRER